MTGKRNNVVYLSSGKVNVLVWLHTVYLEQVYGIYTPRLGGWAW